MRPILFALAVTAAAPAYGQTGPGPVCDNPAVRSTLATILGQRGVPAVVEPGSAGQVPTLLPPLVSCAARIHRVLYDTNRFGVTPLDRIEIVRYTVRIGQNALFVEADAAP